MAPRKPLTNSPTRWDTAPTTPIEDLRAMQETLMRQYNQNPQPDQLILPPDVYRDVVTAQVRVRTGDILVASTYYAQLERAQKYEVRCELCGFFCSNVIPDHRAADTYGGVDHVVNLINKLVGKFRCLETHRKDRMLLQMLELNRRKLEQIPDDVAMVAGDAYLEGMGSSNAITRLDGHHLVRVVALLAPHGYTKEQDVADMYRHMPNPGIFELRRLLSGGRTVARGGEQATQQETDQYLEMRLWCVTDAGSRSRLPFERPVCPTREHQQIVEMSGDPAHSRPEVRMLIERAKRLHYASRGMGRVTVITGKWSP